MSRAVPEWIAKNDNQAIPPRVRLRIFDREGGKCHICKLEIKTAESWDADHILALANGGKHAEANLAPAHKHCHIAKSSADVKTKAKIAAVRKRHIGITQPAGTIASPGFSKPAKPAKSSRWDFLPPLEPKQLFTKEPQS